MAISKNQIKFVRQLEQKKFRIREGLFVAEGTKVVGDLLAHYQPQVVFATENWLAEHHAQLSPLTSGLYPVTPDELRRISFLQHPQQVLALFPIPQPTDVVLGSNHSALTSTLSLALDGIQDPGNLGTIIRIADWFGITDIICSENTVDAWNPKVVQATMGSISRVNIIYIKLPEFLDSLPEDFPVYGTFLDGENIYQQPLSPHGLIIMGNEGNGISPEIRSRVNRHLLIPSYRTDDTAESLNVAIATAITCAEFRRRQP
ncbi:MAG: RNA methyltransferase [Prevotella sp.]|nr:RNA methyltransferase [Prevotella sp.]